MNTTPCYEKEDILINFRDLVMHILRRWRSVVIGAVVVAVLLVGFKYIKDRTAYQNALAAEKEHAATVVLDDASLVNAEQVLLYKKLYREQTEYNRDSLLMQIDPTAVPTHTLSYVVTGKQAYAVAAVYQSHLSDRTLYATIAKKVAPGRDPSMIAELVSTWLQSDNGADAIADHVILNIKVIAPTEELGASIAAELETRVLALESVATKVSAHTLSLVAHTKQQVIDNALKTTQQNNLNNVTTLRNNVKTATEALTAAEKIYIEQMTVLDKDNGTSSPKVPSVSKKMVVLGLALGFVLMAGLHALGYVFNRKVKSREDFAERYGVYVFGTLDGDEASTLSQQQLVLAAHGGEDEKEAVTLAIIGGALDEKQAARFASLCEAAAKQGVTVDVLPRALDDATAFERLTKVDAVVLAETVGASDYNAIYREMDMCERLGRPVLGAFILK